MDLYGKLPEALRQVSGGNTNKLLDAIAEGAWDVLRADIVTQRANLAPTTMNHGRLNRWAHDTLGLGARETHAKHLLFVKGEFRRRVGGSSLDDIARFISVVVGTSVGPGDVTITENEDPTTGAYRPAYYTVEINTALFLGAGFTADEIPDALQDIEDILNQTAAAGVEADVIITGGALYDSGDAFDSGEVYAT